MHDVRSRTAKQQRVTASEERFRTLADSIPQLAWMARPDGYIFWYNQRWHDYTGTTLEQVQGWGWQSVHHPDEVQRVVEKIKTCFTSGEPWDDTFPLRRHDGEYRWHLSRMLPVRDRDGCIRLWFGTNTDITEQREQAALQQKIADAALLVGASLSLSQPLDAILQVITDSARDVLNSHQAVTSRSVDQSWAKTIIAVSLSDKYAEWQTYDGIPNGTGIYSLVCRTNKPMRLTEAEMTKHPAYRAFGPAKGGHPPLRDWLAVPLIGREGRNLGVLQFSDKCDGSEFTAHDEAVAAQMAAIASVAIENWLLLQELKEADRKKNEFLATLAHELRNPLAPIRNAVELLQRASADGSVVDQVRALLQRQVPQMVRLVDDLLDISRISRGSLRLRKERVELAAVVDTAIESARPLINASRHELTTILPPQTVHIDADPIRLAQVFLNLLNNAAKYTEEGGRIWFSAGQQDGEVVVSVRDTGIGIPAEYLPTIFEIYSQETSALERSQGGLGIGLALVRGLVELHGGKIEAHSDGPRKGSEFIVRLPVSVATPDQKPNLGTMNSERKCAAKCRILVVDDNRDSADSLATLLKVIGYDTHTAYDGDEAVTTARTFAPEVVLLDIGMPKVDGYQACHRIREELGGKEIFLVALTGWGQDEDRRRTEEAGFNHHMVKPVEVDALLKLLAKLKLVQSDA